MIHILRGSKYDGYFENVADRIIEVLTPEIKNTILNLKFNTPDNEKVMGIEYYKAVIQDGVRTYSDFTSWRTWIYIAVMALWNVWKEAEQNGIF